jgi:RES domain-containing protein
MPVTPGLAITIPAGTPIFRITDVSFHTARTSLHKNVVNGQGARKSRHGARYNHPGATTVYLAENLEVCFAERMFYFHREVLAAMDLRVRPPCRSPITRPRFSISPQAT